MAESDLKMKVVEKEIYSDIWEGLPEEKIWDEFKQGSNGALIYIYKKYFPLLFNYAIQYNRDREFVRDVIQDLFVYIYKIRKSINSTTSIKFYLFKSLKRRIKAELDKRKSFQLGSFHLMSELSVESQFIDNEDAIRQKKLIQKAIGNLSLKQQEIIYYIYYLNFSYQEAASIMGFSQVKSARKLLYRALESLKKEINLSDLFLLLAIKYHMFM